MVRMKLRTLEIDRELDHTLGNPANAEESYQKPLQVDEILGHDEPGGEAYTRNLLESLKTA